LVLVLETADDFRATIGNLRSLGESKVVDFTPSHSLRTDAYAYY